MGPDGVGLFVGVGHQPRQYDLAVLPKW
jgi:hypothetical protein